MIDYQQSRPWKFFQLVIAGYFESTHNAVGHILTLENDNPAEIHPLETQLGTETL